MVLCVFQGTERWTSKSSLLQVLISIQGAVGLGSGRGVVEGGPLARSLGVAGRLGLMGDPTHCRSDPGE